MINYEDKLQNFEDMQPKFSDEFGLKYKHCLKGTNTLYRGQIKIWFENTLEMLPGLGMYDVGSKAPVSSKMINFDDDNQDDYDNNKSNSKSYEKSENDNSDSLNPKGTE